ncbi:hypothetical protein ES703_94720 [subsurface metagenome]
MEVPPSPKLHDQEVGFSVDRSVNDTLRGSDPERGVPVKSAAGSGPLVTVM